MLSDTGGAVRASEAFEISIDGSTVGGLLRKASPTVSKSPLVLLAIHGGTYTSRYFDVPGYSLMERAARRGFDIVAVDRPGYGVTTALPDAPDLIQKSAEYLNRIVPNLLRHIGRPDVRVVLLGHSIGGAIAVSMAALQPFWNLAGVAISGVGQASPHQFADIYAMLPATYFVELPSDMKDQVMFGPEGTRRADMPWASHGAGASVPRSELTDITGGWPIRLPALAQQVSVPLHYRQGEHEKLWLVSPALVSDFAALFVASPRVDAALLPGAGHCIDYHLGGASFQDEQLDFAAGLS